MASKLAAAHIAAQARLRAIVTQAVGGIWTGLPGYDNENLDQWLSQVVPLVDAGQRQSVALTDAFVAQSLRRAPLGLDPASLTGADVRAGAPPEQVYKRSFITVWTALGNHDGYDQAVAAGRARARSAAAMDMQLSMRATSQAIQEADDSIIGWARAADPGACAFCAMLDGAFVKSADAAGMHNGCGCGLDPVTGHQRHSTPLPDGVAVHDHGELGPYLTDPAHHFTTESQI